MPFPQDASLPKDSLILVTGVTGFLASIIANELLNHGYRVRGTARDLNSVKASWMPSTFEDRYGKGRFEMVQVADLAEKRCLEEAVKGCDGVIHPATNLSYSPDPNIVVTQSIAFVENALEAAAKEPSVKRFVFTSSSSAAAQNIWNRPYDLTADMYSEWAVKAAWAPPPYEMDRVFSVYNASKAQSEQALWKFVKTQKPAFVVNTVLPDLIVGLPVNLQKQGHGPSGQLLQDLWNCGEFWKTIPPQFVIDGRDCALLHLAALLHPGLIEKRLFGYAHNKTWTDWINRLRRMYPNHALPDPPPNEDRILANVIGQSEAENAIRWMGKDGWTPVEESMKKVFDSML